MTMSDRRGLAAPLRRQGDRPPADLAQLLRVQRDACHQIGSDLYARLIEHAIKRVDRPGPIRDLLAPHAGDSFGSALALRFLGAVHRLVLEGRAPELAVHYPSVGGTPGPAAEAAFESTIAAHLPELAERIHDGVQTNEVGRSATLVGAFLELADGGAGGAAGAGGDGTPLRIFEVGASAGLNLRWDHYRYEAGGQAFGDPSSPVRFVEPWVGRRPRLDRTGTVVERRGCDLSPIDATTPEGRLTLQAFVWPDLVERFRRLDAAIEVARRVPAAVDRADVSTWLPERLATPAPGTATVVVHSIVAQYLPTDVRWGLRDTVTAAGAEATPSGPVAWLRMEPGRDGAEVRLTTWPGGEDRLLAVSAYHGPPVRWLVT